MYIYLGIAEKNIVEKCYFFIILVLKYCISCKALHYMQSFSIQRMTSFLLGRQFFPSLINFFQNFSILQVGNKILNWSAYSTQQYFADYKNSRTKSSQLLFWFKKSISFIFKIRFKAWIQLLWSISFISLGK